MHPQLVIAALAVCTCWWKLAAMPTKSIILAACVVAALACGSHAEGDGGDCTVMWHPNATVLQYPQDLGIQWSFSYDTQWWLGIFEDVTTPGRHLGVELSVLHSAPSNYCNDTSGVVLMFVGLSDSHTQTYTQTAVGLQLNASSTLVSSTAVPYNVSLASTTNPLFRAGVEQVGPTPSTQRIFADHVPSWDAGFELNVNAQKPIENVRMADDGFLFDVLLYFMQVAQPNLDGTATIRTANETIRGRGKVWLQHMFGSIPSFDKSVRSEMKHLVQPDSPEFALVWTWQCAMLDNGISLSLTDFTTGTLKYVNVVNTTTGANHEYKDSEFSVVLSDEWVSPKSGVSYARRSDVTIPAANIALTWITLVPDNEHFLPNVITYYEAASLVNGTVGGVPVTGTGYLEHKKPTAKF